MGYESRLQQELQQFHSRTNLGMEQLRLQTREMFERENRQHLTVLYYFMLLVITQEPARGSRCRSYRQGQGDRC